MKTLHPARGRLRAACLLIPLALIVFPVSARQKAPAPRDPITIRVPADEPTIQAGIDAARDRDTVLVADGVYTGTGNRDIDGEPRVFGTFIDMGADEFSSCGSVFRQYFATGLPLTIPDDDPGGLPAFFSAGSFFDGVQINGTWTLQLIDRSPGLVGTLNFWRLDQLFTLCF